MPRKITAILAAAVALVIGLGSTALASDRIPARFLSVSGALEYTSDLAVYEVNGYILLGVSTDATAMVGSEVLVVGTEVPGPSIYMHRTLQVASLVPNPSSVSTPDGNEEPGALPVPDLPGQSESNPKPEPPTTTPPPAGSADDSVTVPVIDQPREENSDDDPRVTIPVITGPGEESSTRNPDVTIPVITDPVPLSDDPTAEVPAPASAYGTGSCMLFGRIQQIQAEYYVVDPVNAHFRYWVRSSKVDLGALVDQLVGAVADARTLSSGAVQYEITSTIDLSRDLSDLVQNGDGLIFQMPAREIAIRLHGQTMHWMPTPIIGNGRTLVGLRAVSEAIGASVAWDDAMKTATVSLGDREVSVTLGSNKVSVRQKGQPDIVVHNDTASVISDDRMMVPLRVLSEGLGLTVVWNDASWSIDLD